MLQWPLEIRNTDVWGIPFSFASVSGSESWITALSLLSDESSIPKEKLDHSVLLLPPKRREGCAEAHNLKPFTLVCYSGPGLCDPGSLATAALKGNLWKNPTAKWAPVQTKGAWSHWREIAHKCHGDWSNRFLFACVYFIFWNKNLQGRTNVSCTTASSKTVSN